MKNNRQKLGQAVVEFALVMPILIILFLAIIELAIFMNNHLSVANAAREGARAAAVGRAPDAVKSRVTKLATGLAPITSNDITLQSSANNGSTWTNLVDADGDGFNDAGPGDLIRVTVNIEHNQLTGIVPYLSGIDIRKVVTMKREP